LISNYVIHIGFSGFPKGNASVQRTRLTFRGLKEQGYNCFIINKISHHERQVNSNAKWSRSESIPYINTALLGYRPKSFLLRNINKISGYIGEFILLCTYRKKIQTAILYSNYFAELPYYWILSKVFNFKIIYQYVEFFSKIPGRDSFFTKLNDRLVDNCFFKFSHGVICISDYLMEHLRSKDTQIPAIKLPAICDYKALERVKSVQIDPYIMYCGTIYYEEVIVFILDIFENLKIKKLYEGNLLLILSGSHDSKWSQLSYRLNNHPYFENIILRKNQPFNDILPYYLGADVLLIPLRNTIQDIARFPHKIGEYTASKRPIISTNLGEVKKYFMDGISAMLTENYVVEEYVQKLSQVLSQKEWMSVIGKNGYEMGIRNFDYQAQCKKLSDFILLVNKPNSKPKGH
jgi:glycosyltransferase involved in cell wall biosynthesis